MCLEYQTSALNPEYALWNIENNNTNSLSTITIIITQPTSGSTFKSHNGLITSDQNFIAWTLSYVIEEPSVLTLQSNLTSDLYQTGTLCVSEQPEEWHCHTDDNLCANDFQMSPLLTEINTLRPRQNGRHFPDGIFKWIFLNKNISISNRFHWILFPMLQLTIFKHWFR